MLLLLALLASLIGGWFLLTIASSSRFYIEQPLPANQFDAFAKEMRSDLDISIILIDGLGSQLFYPLLSAGKLPRLAALIQSGTLVSNGIGAFPSMTGYAFYSFLTGHAASVSQIGGLRWLLRSDASRPALRNYVGSGNVLMNSDIPSDIPLLFERFGPDAVSSSINTYMNRGTTHSEKLGWALTTAKYGPSIWYIHMLKLLKYVIGDRIYRDFFEFETASFDRAIAHLADYQPRVQWITAAALDSYVHVYGLENREYVDALIVHLDSLIGNYVDAAQKIGKNKRLFAIVSDHGMTQISTNIDVTDMLYGISGTFRVVSESMVLIPFNPKALDEYQSIDVIVAVNGNNLCHLYFKNPDPLLEPASAWLTRPTVAQLSDYPDGGETLNLLHELAGQPGIEFVMAKSDAYEVSIWDPSLHSCVIKCSNCHLKETRKPDRRYTYQCEASKDLLDVRRALTGHLALTRDEWAHISADSAYPFAVPRIYEMFESHSTGDVVLTALPTFDFGRDYELFVGNYRGGHGGLHRDQVISPYILFGEGIKPGVKLPHSLSEDIGATLIHIATSISSPDSPNLKSLDGQVLQKALL